MARAGEAASRYPPVFTAVAVMTAVAGTAVLPAEVLPDEVLSDSGPDRTVALTDGWEDDCLLSGALEVWERNGIIA